MCLETRYATKNSEQGTPAEIAIPDHVTKAAKTPSRGDAALGCLNSLFNPVFHAMLESSAQFAAIHHIPR